MTLKEIAQSANVSISTVSRVINDKYSKAASSETKDKIWEIVRESGYTPNVAARQLRKTSDPVKPALQPNYFACIFARSQDNKDMFFSELAHAIEDEAFKHNYILKYSIYAGDLDANGLASTLAGEAISGTIVLGRFNDDHAKSVVESKKNVVYVSLNPGSSKHDIVFCDGYNAGLLAMKTLLDLGHTEIAYMGSTKNESRYRSYIKTHEENKMIVERKRVIETAQTLDGGYQAVKQLFQSAAQFTAIFCANDATAMGAIRALREQKIRVPEDVSVISIDDMEMARYFQPMLTTVHIPIVELGKQAIKCLVDRVERGHVLPLKTELPFSLISRESCAKRGGSI